MKILWVNPNFLHPTTKGGQIRTLEMVRRLHRRHEVHYVAFENPAEPEGVARAREYSSFAYPVQHRIPSKRSPAFALQLAANLFSAMPLAVSRYHSHEKSALIARLMAQHSFDKIVCDFLFPAPNFPALNRCVLFQHNVEAIIWQRHYETASSLPRRILFRQQSRRMLRYERDVCRASRWVIAVSGIDALRMHEMYGIDHVSSVPTGVDTDYFALPPSPPPRSGIVFVGSMDWMPNIDGMRWFLEEVLPLIRRRLPDCPVSIVGRTPDPSLVELASRTTGVTVTGTVPDVRPYLWNAAVCVVPLRIGGGTRLKIYEAMAARVPVVSTTIGAEGLPLESGAHIAIADDPQHFAGQCVRLLEQPQDAAAQADRAWHLVASTFSWDAVTDVFEDILVQHG